MKRILASIFVLGSLFSAPAFAAGDEPSFENGPVWDYGEIKTADGHFDDYMEWLSTKWKAQEEALKKAGVILSYKVLLVVDPRKDEPDILLAQEYKNMAEYDTPVAKQYALQAQIAGSLAKSSQEQAARGTIRTVLGDIIVREAILK
jgi:hypothetical protein